MPKYVPTTISYVGSGVVKDKDAFNLTEDSFQTLENAYTRRGRIYRRRGYTLLGRLRRNLTASSIGNYSTVNGTNTLSIFSGLAILATEPNASLEAGNLTNLTISFGVPISQSLTNTDGTSTLTVVGAGPITSASINYATGIISITATGIAGPSAVTFTGAYYPSLPVMGLRTRELTTINAEQLVAFDMKYAYRLVGSSFEEFPSVTPTTWNGTNSDFFYTTNYFPNFGQKDFWTTNFNKDATPDPIRYYDDNIGDWVTFAPNIDGAGGKLQQTRFLIPYRGYFVALNTYEGATLGGSSQFAQRARNSQFNDPLNVNAWLSDVAGRGSFIDAPTSEAIVSADFVRDVLIVGFERSTWKLRYTGNRLQPFVWERINRELGCESSFSTVPFDQGLLQVGDKAITICSGNEVTRIDQNIPDEVFLIHNESDGPKRVYGIRDFYQQQVYWTFPDEAQNGTFPNRVLVHDYIGGAWSFFTDSFTCFGTFQSLNDLIWSKANFSWETADQAWVDARTQSGFPAIVAGNQQGYVVIVNQEVANENSLQITAITAGSPAIFTIPDHNLQSNEYIILSSILGNWSTLNDGIYQVYVIDSNNVNLFSLVNGIFQPVNLSAGDYFGLGQVTRVMNYSIRSKKFNFSQNGSQVRIGFLDVLTKTTESGEVTCRFYIDYEDSNPVNPDNSDGFFNTRFSTAPTQFDIASQSKIWQRVFCNTPAEFFEFEFTLSPEQMNTLDIVNEDLLVDSFIIWAAGAGRLTK